MPRKDYDEIKDKFGAYISSWKSRDISILDGIFATDVQVYLSVSENIDNSQHTIEGVKKFVSDFPKTDVFHSAIFNFICRIQKDEAQQYGIVICTSLNYVDGKQEMDTFYYAAMISNHWTKTEDGWKVDEMKMDMDPRFGNLRDYFAQTWYFGNPLADIEDNLRLPCIQGEFDSPWVRIPEAEDVLTEEEKLKDVVNKRFFAVDHIVIDHAVSAYSKNYNVNAKKFGKSEGVRTAMSSLKYKRQKDRSWVHPYSFDIIAIDGDKAYSDGYRMCGHAQRNHEYVWTRDNVNMEHTCSTNYMEYIKEDGQWKILYGSSSLGITERGEYTGSVYGDRV